jgi:hypothetical protein
MAENTTNPTVINIDEAESKTPNFVVKLVTKFPRTSKVVAITGAGVMAVGVAAVVGNLRTAKVLDSLSSVGPDESIVITSAPDGKSFTVSEA